MIPDTYVWLAWSTAFIVPWVLLWIRFPLHRGIMIRTSLLTAPFGLTEPLFVPEYWNPPSLFNLAQTTGFDIESLIFCFGIGGVGAVLVNVLTRHLAIPLGSHEKRSSRHRYHYLALASPFIVFPLLLPLAWNPIYPGIVAMFVGAVATTTCRPDLIRNTFLGAIIFLIYYLVFLFGLELISPGYIDRVWNMAALSGVTMVGFPIEELLFGTGFGAYWASAYEHFSWHGSVRRHR